MAIEVQVSLSYEASQYVAALHDAIDAALPGKLVGLSTYSADRPVSIFLDDSTSKSDQNLASNTIKALDPKSLQSNEQIAQAKSKTQAETALAAFDAAPDKLDWQAGQDAQITLKAVLLKLDDLEKRLKALGG